MTTHSRKGKLIVLGGGDGTGKETNAELLVARIRKAGFKVFQYDFPRYGKPPHGSPSSWFVRKYLQKKEFGFKEGYGAAAGVNPIAASLAYAIDRFDAAHCHEQRPNMWDLLSERGNVLVCNRYTESNIGHQASKIDDYQKRVEMMRWIDHFEYDELDIPRPDLVLLLNMHPDVGIALKRRQRESQGASLDAHEKDTVSLRKSYQAYLEAAQVFSDHWRLVEASRIPRTGEDPITCTRSLKDIQADIWRHIEPILLG